MGAGIVKPDLQNGIRIQIHTGRNSATMGSHHSSSDLKCEECTSKFSQFKKQLPCKDCDRKFCSVCYVSALRQCKKCQILLSGNFTRPQLKQWKPKDLKALLHKHDVNTSKCREKDDLIDLIFSYFGTSNGGGNRSGRTSRNSSDDRRPPSQTEQQSNVAGASQSGYTPNRTETSQTGNSMNEPYINSGTQSSHTRNGMNEPSQNNGTQSSQTGSGLNNQSRTGSQSEPMDTNEKNEGDMSRIKLEDVKSEEHIEQLSIKCLKRLLLNNFVDYKGCCERWELQERVKRLWKDDQANKQKADQQRKVSDDPSLATNTSSNSDDDLCKICMDAAIDCVLLECGHMVTCTQCGKRLSECPICRQYVVRAVHIFKA